MPFTIPLVGANPSRRTSTGEFKVGTTELDDSNRTWVYVGPAANAINAAATCTVATTISGGMQFGSRCRNTMRDGGSARQRAASTYSLPFSTMAALRTVRA